MTPWKPQLMRSRNEDDVRSATQFSGNWIDNCSMLKNREHVNREYGSFHALDNFKMIGGHVETGNH